LFSSITVSFVPNVIKLANNLFILTIRAIAKSILGPVTSIWMWMIILCTRSGITANHRKQVIVYKG
jgi:hypothetical protein